MQNSFPKIPKFPKALEKQNIFILRLQVPESEIKKEAFLKGNVLFEINLSAAVPKGQHLLVGFRGDRKQAPSNIHFYDSAILSLC